MATTRRRSLCDLPRLAEFRLRAAVRPPFLRRLLPRALACVVARFTADTLIGHNLDERMILSKGVPYLEHEAHPTSAAIKIGDALKEARHRRGPIIAFRPHERLQVLLNALILTEHNAFPVLEDVETGTGLKGLVTRAMLQRVLRVVLEKKFVLNLLL